MRAARFTPPATRFLKATCCGLASASLLTPTFAQSRTFTRLQDFQEGLSINLESPTSAPDQLQLPMVTTPLESLWVACTGRDTVVRLSTDNGVVFGEYRCASEDVSGKPSTVAVDADGNCWIANRGGGTHQPGRLVKLGITIGGTRVDKFGQPKPNGLFLAPPFVYNTCIDRNGDGYIKTSRGLNDVLNWKAGEDPDDEAVLFWIETAPARPRHLSIDASNHLWVGGYPTAPNQFQRLKTGSGVLLESWTPPGCGGYRGLLDAHGRLWSTSPNEHQVVRYDTALQTESCLFVSHAHDLALAPDGDVWITQPGLDAVMRLDPLGVPRAGFPVASGGTTPTGLTIRPHDASVWIAHSASDTVTRLDSQGVLLASIPVGADPADLSVDAAGKLWVSHTGEDALKRIDPDAGSSGLGAVDLSLDLGASAVPDSSGDMTGLAALGVAADRGSWTVIFDTGTAATTYNTIQWTAQVPVGAWLSVEARAADEVTELTGRQWEEVFAGIPPSALQGRHLELRLRMGRDPSGLSSPVLEDITVAYGCGGPIQLSQDPLIVGTTVNFAVQACPGEVVFFYKSHKGTAPNAGPCFPTFGGLCVDLIPKVSLFHTATADAAGIATYSRALGSRFVGRRLYTQGVVARGVGGVDSVKSNVVEDTIRF